MLRCGIFNVPMPYGIYRMSQDSFLCASLQGDSADLPRYNALQRDLQPVKSSPFKVLLSLRKVVRYMNFLCTFLLRRKETQEPILQPRWAASKPKYS